MLKLGQWKGKDKWLFLLTLGVVFCILAFPAERLFGGRETGTNPENRRELTADGETVQTDGTESAQASARAAENSFEQQLETRVKEFLSRVDGVGEVDVMIVLKSSSEKIWQTDTSSRSSDTEENQENLSRSQVSREEERSTVQMGGSGSQEPLLVKELLPELSGVIISADGGGSPAVRQEISSAMEALFGLPAHKIKVLKRVE